MSSGPADLNQLNETVSELKSFSFFSGFPEELLTSFAEMVQKVQFDKGHLLLQQGEKNESLYFLREGKLSVEVDGEMVSELTVPGEVVGEMSLISRRAVTASVRAQTEVSVFQVSESQLAHRPEDERNRFQHLLYRVYASVLAGRLSRTNDKAKRFEIANRQLEAAHESLRLMNENLQTEIGRRSQELVQKVFKLTETHLQPAQSTLSRWAQSSGIAIDSAEVHKLLRSISEVVDFLKPVAEFGQKGRALESRKVLLFDTNKKQQTVARLALGGTGVDLTMASSVEELETALNQTEFDLIFCDAEVKEAVEKAIALKPKVPLALIVNLDMNFYLETIKSFPSQSFFVSRDVDNRLFTIKNISTTVAKILNRDYFGMEKYLSWGANISERPVKESGCRLELIEQMKEYFKGLGIRSSFLDRIHTVTEELLMNAIYDAPMDKKTGRSLYNHLPRTEKVSLAPEHQSTLRFGTDGVLLAVSVKDPFGGLKKEIITNYLESCYSGRAGELNKEKGGAGRGLHMIIETSDVTVFNVEQGQSTEVICLFNLDKTQAEKSQPTFHLFLTGS